MNGFATTTVSILRGTTETVDGDAMDNGDAIATGVPANYREVVTRNRRESSSRPGNVRKFVVRLPRGTDIQDGDRIRDERTGLTVTVDFVSRLSVSLPANADLKVMARSVD